MLRIHPLLIPGPLLLWAIASPAAAFQSTRGLASSLAAGVSLHQNTPGTTGEAQVSYPGSRKPAEDYGTVWDRYSGANIYQGTVRDFSLDALFPDDNFPAVQGVSSFHELVEINAFSTGNALIPKLDSWGRPDPTLQSQTTGQAGSWLGINVSVESGAQGNSPSSFVALAGQNGRSNGSDLFSYYFANSDGLHSSLPGNNFIEQRREDLGLSAGQEVDGIDLAMGVQARSSSTPIVMFGIETDRFYFSLTKSSADEINLRANDKFWEDDNGNWQEACAAAVYLVEYENGGWGKVQEVCSAGDLGLDPQEDDLDALDVQVSPEVIIYSFARRQGSTQPLDSQLMIRGTAQGAAGPANRALRDSANNRTVTNRIGLDDEDDVDAVCVVDPEAGEMASHIGTPITDLGATGLINDPLVDLQLGISMTRSAKVDANGIPVNGLDTIYVQVCSDTGDRLDVYFHPNFVDWSSVTPDALFQHLGTAFRLDGESETITLSIDVPSQSSDPLLNFAVLARVSRSDAPDFYDGGWSMVSSMRL